MALLIGLVGVGVELAEGLLAWRCEWSVVTWGDGQLAANVPVVVYSLFEDYGRCLK